MNFGKANIWRDFNFDNLQTTKILRKLNYTNFGNGLSPAGNYMFKLNNKNARTRCEICSKLTIKTPKRRSWCRSGVFTVNFEHISHLVLVFLLLTLSK